MPCREESNQNTKTFHFTLGPVQGFVAQARRTRDLWAGSFLLAYLSGHAMYAVIKAGGKIIFPAVYDVQKPERTDRLLKAIIDCQEGGGTDSAPDIGTLPNRFMAEVNQSFNPGQCRQAVRDAWQKIAQVVWDEFIYKTADLGNQTEAIWQRQVNSFWDISWVEGKEDNLLDRRKNWRTHILLPENGDKCTIAGNLQEISGYIRSKRKAKQKQDEFWETLREQKQMVGLDLRSDERLSAIMLVKRLFPRVAKEAVGWDLPVNYPSTVYLAATHWIEKMIYQQSEKAAKYAQEVRTNLRESYYSEYNTKVKCIESKAAKKPEARNFANLDGNVFYKDKLENDRLWSENTEQQRKQLVKLLKEFEEKPNPYYALLLMDGDKLGALLRKYKKEDISRSLDNFTRQVRKIIEENNGMLIYAGGDDVLALLPLEDALKAAVNLRQTYQDAFSSKVPSRHATVSASIVYAHYNAPLKAVLQQAHYLLADIAKDKTGRDSLAVQVWNTSGPALCWAAPWKKIITEEGNLIDELINEFKGTSGDIKKFNSSFFYNIRKYFEMLSSDAAFKLNLNFVDLMTAEYLKNIERKGLDIKVAKERMDRLEIACRRYQRQGEPDFNIQAKGITPDGAFLVRFLAEKEVTTGGEC